MNYHINYFSYVILLIYTLALMYISTLYLLYITTYYLFFFSIFVFNIKSCHVTIYMREKEGRCLCTYEENCNNQQQGWGREDSDSRNACFTHEEKGI